MPVAITSNTQGLATSQIASDSQGYLWVAMTDTPYGADGTLRLYRSMDKGSSWTLVRSVTGYNHRNTPQLWIDRRNDAAYVSNGQVQNSSAGNDDQLFRFVRNGASYNAPTALTWSYGSGLANETARMIGIEQANGKAVLLFVGGQWQASNGYALLGRMVLTSAGAVESFAMDTIISAPNNYMAAQAADFNHTGDGYTTTQSYPDLYVVRNGNLTFAEANSQTLARWYWDGTKYVESANKRNIRGQYGGGDVGYSVGGLLYDGGDYLWFVGSPVNTGFTLYSANRALTTAIAGIAATPSIPSSETIIGANSLVHTHKGNSSDFYLVVGTTWTGGPQYQQRIQKIKATRTGAQTLSYGSWSIIGSRYSSESGGNKTIHSRAGVIGAAFAYSPTDNSAMGMGWELLATLNTAPNAAVITALTGGQAVDLGSVNRGSWNFSDPDPGDTQSKADIRYRKVGAATWTTLTITTPNTYYDFPANTFTAGDYEWQVLTYDAQGTAASAWSALAFFTAAVAPAAPTITDPVNNSTVSVENYLVKWSAPEQTAYQIQTLDMADAVISDSGTVNDSVARSHPVTFPANNVSRKIRVRVAKNGLFSQWTTITVNVAYTAPAAFTFSATPVDLAGIGFTHAYSIVTNHPAPVAPQPNVAYEDIYIRKQGEETDGERIAFDKAPGDPFFYYTPASGVVYEFRIRAVGTNETSTWSAWQAATPVSFEGVLLHDPLDHDGSILHIVYNSEGASDTLEVEHSFHSYQGREYPTVEFGDASERTVEVGLVQSLNGESAAVRKLIARRTILCYRDSVGRKLYAVMGTHPEQDTFYGHDTSLSFTEVEYNEAV